MQMDDDLDEQQDKRDNGKKTMAFDFFQRHFYGQPVPSH
jgi:hypothetical protein